MHDKVLLHCCTATVTNDLSTSSSSESDCVKQTDAICLLHAELSSPCDIVIHQQAAAEFEAWTLNGLPGGWHNVPICCAFMERRHEFHTGITAHISSYAGDFHSLCIYIYLKRFVL